MHGTSFLDITHLADHPRIEVASALRACEKSDPRNSKLNVIQSIIASIFVKDIFSSYFFGLSDDQVRELQSVEEYFKNIGNALPRS